MTFKEIREASSQICIITDSVFFEYQQDSPSTIALEGGNYDRIYKKNRNNIYDGSFIAADSPAFGFGGVDRVSGFI